MTPRSPWDIRGKQRQHFWEEVSNLQLRALYHRSDVRYQDDAIRQIGALIEENLLKSTLGWLEVQFPKGGPGPGTKWKPKSPITGPRYLRDNLVELKAVTAQTDAPPDRLPATILNPRP